MRNVGLEVVWWDCSCVAGKVCSWICETGFVVAGGWVGWSCFVWLWMESVVLEHDCVETVVVIGSIFDGSFRAVGLNKAVATFDNATVAFFRLAFHVASMFVLDIIGEVVFGVGFVVDGLVIFVMLSDWTG